MALPWCPNGEQSVRGPSHTLNIFEVRQIRQNIYKTISSAGSSQGDADDLLGAAAALSHSSAWRSPGARDELGGARARRDTGAAVAFGSQYIPCRRAVREQDAGRQRVSECTCA